MSTFRPVRYNMPAIYEGDTLNRVVTFRPGGSTDLGDISAATLMVKRNDNDENPALMSVAGSVVDNGDNSVTITFAQSAAVMAAISAGVYRYQITVTFAGGNTFTFAYGDFPIVNSFR